MYDLDIMEGVKFEDMMDWIQGLQGMEDIAKAFTHSTLDDPNMSQLQIQWKLDHEVQQAFKRPETCSDQLYQSPRQCG